MRNNKIISIILAILIVIIIFLAGFIGYEKLVVKDNNKNSGNITKNEKVQETEITDNAIVNDLSEKVTALNVLSGFNETKRYDSGRAITIAIGDSTGEKLYSNDLTETDKLSIVLLNRVSFKDVTINEAKKRNPPYYGQVSQKEVEEEYLKLFGTKLTSHKDAGMCPGFTYDSKNQVYYGSTECGDVGVNYLYLYKNKFTKKDNYAYVYVNVGHNFVIDDESNKILIYDGYDSKDNTNVIERFNGDTGSNYKISSSNYSDFTEYKYIFKKDSNDNYFFERVEKVNNSKKNDKPYIGYYQIIDYPYSYSNKTNKFFILDMEIALLNDGKATVAYKMDYNDQTVTKKYEIKYTSEKIDNDDNDNLYLIKMNWGSDALKDNVISSLYANITYNPANNPTDGSEGKPSSLVLKSSEAGGSIIPERVSKNNMKYITE